MDQKNPLEITEIRNAFYYLLLMCILTLFVGAFNIIYFLRGRNEGTLSFLLIFSQLAISFFCFYTSQRLKKLAKGAYVMALGFAIFIGIVTLAGFFHTIVREDLITATLFLGLCGLSIHIVMGLVKKPVKSLVLSK